MRKTFFAAAIAATSLVTLPALAQDSSGYLPTYSESGYLPTQSIGSGNWFIDAGIGRTGSSSSGGFGSNIGNDFNFGKSQRGRKTGYSLFGGYRWKLGPNLALGLEAGYADLGNFKLQNTFNGDKIDQTSTTQALRGRLVGANGRINLATQWYLSARGGFFHANGSNHIYDKVDQNLGEFTTAKAGRNGWYAGVGTGWDIDQHWGVGLSYDYYHANAGRVRLGADQDIATLKRSTSMLSLTGEYRF
jgi:OOP family OmpA-OmpF porin/outer membrane immunogenic protein